MEKFTNKKIDLNTIQHWLLIPLFCAINHSALATTVPQQEQNAIFQAAKFKRLSGSWVSPCSMGYISDYQDFNKDGRMDAILIDGGTRCYGTIGTGFHIMTMQANKQWTPIFRSPGSAVMLTTTGRHGWPDIRVENDSACYAVYRWDGRQYAINRYEKNGKTCNISKTDTTKNMIQVKS